MGARLVRASVWLSTIVFVASACSGTPSGNGAISVSGGAGTSGNTSTNVSGGAAATGGRAAAGGTSAAVTQSKGATIVPLYSYPTEPPWTAILAAKLAHPNVPVIAIANVDNGPGTAVDGTFTSGIRSLTTAGILVIGYVYTSYGARTAATVRADIDAWRRFYPTVSGIFFDEESNTNGGDTYYRDLGAYVKSNAMTLTVGNPGTDTSAAYINALDVTFIYESAGLPSASLVSAWASRYPRQSVGVIPYAATFDLAWVQQSRGNIGYIYVTNDDLPNPWDTLPSYFSNLLAALE